MPSLTPGSVRDLLAAHGCRPSRALGQHFLADPNLARKIVRLADAADGDLVVEIGPGIGSLTVALAEAGTQVVALELDRHLLPVLAEVLAGSSHPEAVEVVQGDGMTADFRALTDGRRWVCVSNLPYNVATPMVVRLLEEFPEMTRCLVMVQKEVGERLVAGPGTKAYGAVSVKVAYYALARMVGTVAATVFVPPPNVASALVLLDRRDTPPVDVPSPEALFTLVRAGFGQRRKTLRRALAGTLGERTESVLDAAGVDPSARAETLTLDDWARVCREAA
ncbi:MAG: 16S rRNA (adenine(1518)-N(6)/adenine(1519)-N(6))-dimethyltransferase RsmA [Actinobacteria bacterium]|nr:16S rRNA (adenine(1518)-N(6)/adenine(1519)-N(6))-dimethyltransferase RsmA [Actinomycetota bacterium]